MRHAELVTLADAYPHLSDVDIDALTDDECRAMLDAHAAAGVEQRAAETPKPPARSGNVSRASSRVNPNAPSSLLRGHRVAPGCALSLPRGIVGPGELLTLDDFKDSENPARTDEVIRNSWDAAVAAGRIVPEEKD